MRKRKKKNSLSTTIISSLSYLVLGIIMIVWPSSVEIALCYAFGTAMTIYGLFNIISFFINRESGLYIEMIIGVLLTAFGVFALISPETIRGILFFAIGIVIIIDSMLDIKHAFRLRAYAMKYWWIYLILSLIIIAVGVSTIIFSGFFANIIMILLGALLVYEGISGLSIVGFASYYGRKISEIQRQNTRIIDVEAEDVD